MTRTNRSMISMDYLAISHWMRLIPDRKLPPLVPPLREESVVSARSRSLRTQRRTKKTVGCTMMLSGAGYPYLAGCLYLEEESKEMPRTQLTRRTFIKAIGATGVSVCVLWAAPGTHAWFGPRLALAAELTTLSATQAQEMLAMARQLFPHDQLGDEYYWVVVESIDKDMAGSAELAVQIRAGLAKLSEEVGGDFATASSDKQLAAMKKLEPTPFFATMLGKTQFYFYNNKGVWPKFGYEGSSWEKGGYINRGFNDVTWTDG